MLCEEVDAIAASLPQPAQLPDDVYGPDLLTRSICMVSLLPREDKKYTDWFCLYGNQRSKYTSENGGQVMVVQKLNRASMAIKIKTTAVALLTGNFLKIAVVLIFISALKYIFFV